MRYLKPVMGVYLLYCFFSVVFADDLSEVEKEMLLNPPGMGHLSNDVAIYSRVTNTITHKAIDSQFDSIYEEGFIAPEESDPYLKINKDGIKVYVYKHKNSVFGTFRAVTHMNVSMDSILAVILDIEASTKWIDACKKAILIKKIAFNEQYHYQTFYVPVPFHNRDFILHSVMEQNSVTKAITITMNSVPSYCLDKQSKQCREANQSSLVRVKKSIGTLKLEPDDNGTLVTWVQHTDPAGHLPGWLVNQLVMNTPYRSLKTLNKMAQYDYYQSAKLIYDSDGVAIALNTSVNSENKFPELKLDYGFFPSF